VASIWRVSIIGLCGLMLAGCASSINLAEYKLANSSRSGLPQQSSSADHDVALDGMPRSREYSSKTLPAKTGSLARAPADAELGSALGREVGAGTSARAAITVGQSARSPSIDTGPGFLDQLTAADPENAYLAAKTNICRGC
jgi:hypothetical protein